MSVVGGESSSLYVNGILPGQSSIFVGAGSTQSAVTYPSQTIEAWAKFSATAIAALGSTGGSDGGSAAPTKNGAIRLGDRGRGVLGAVCAMLVVVCML